MMPKTPLLFHYHVAAVTTPANIHCHEMSFVVHAINIHAIIVCPFTLEPRQLSPAAPRLFANIR